MIFIFRAAVTRDQPRKNQSCNDNELYVGKRLAASLATGRGGYAMSLANKDDYSRV